MPYSVFFLGGYAIHGTNDLKRLGRPASHGCIRLHPRNAAQLFNLVRKVGRADTRIVITR
jgi:lipoprotein-anchoring transpeptidase ErfK/SrfK